MNFKLTPFFKEIIEKRWSEFADMEANSETYTSAQAVVFSIVRACAKGKLPAIKESLNRIDGRLQEQIEVEYPKFYIIYPQAKSLASGTTSSDEDTPKTTDMVPKEPEPEAPLVTGSLRDTLQRMSDAPKAIVEKILTAAEDVDAKKSYESNADPLNDPLVKSVIVAGLLRLAHNGSLNAIFEVFDNLDGKLVDKIKVLGEDVYLTSYDEVAPVGAKKNKDGIYQVEADNTSSKWAIGFENNRKVGR